MEAINVISYVLTFLYVITIIAFLKGWYSLPNYIAKSNVSTTVSIIVACRNEARYIGTTIQDLLNQNYPSELLEIIVINDHSTDSTAEIVSSFKEHGVKLIHLNEGDHLNSYKKKAIEKGIAYSKGKLIVTTDADCRMNSTWLKTMVSFYEDNEYKMISSPVAYFDEKNLFERCQTLEFSYLIGLGASTIGNNKPTTCNGANLAYERDAFEEVNGFQGIDDLASGDDELLLHKMVAKYGNRVGFLKNRDAIVYTRAKSTFKEFIQQRKRWASKSTRYKNKGIVLLGLCFWLFNLSIITNALLAFTFDNYLFWKIFAVQLFAKILMELFFLFRITSFFRRKQLLVLQPLVSTLHIIYILYIGIAGNIGKYKWKDRMVK